MSSQGIYTTAAVTTVGVIGGACCAYHIYKKFQKLKLPTEWRAVGTLKDLYIYPIKSCGPILLNEAKCTILGLRDGWLRDRLLMVVDEKDNFITARGHPELLFVQPTVQNSILTLKHQDMEPICVDLAEVVALQKPKSARVWGVTVPVYDCGWEVSEWFSRLLNKTATSFRLVHYASENSREYKLSINKFYKFTKNDTGAFPDEVPFHLINEASVDELNTRLDGFEVNHRYFRPNFVITGAKAYEEDNWKFIKIGSNVFETIKPCTRCIVTTIDPDTGVRNTEKEPLRTLKTYRQIEDPVERKVVGNSPRMGLQIALRSEPGGIISINDTIYVA